MCIAYVTCAGKDNAKETHYHNRQTANCDQGGEQMALQKLAERITIDPAICHGKPCIRSLRYPVETILELLSAGMTIDEILDDYEDLEREDILAALVYATRLSQVKRLEAVVA